MEKEYICIACPIGCHLKLHVGADKSLEVSGNKCKRGEVYAITEFSEPTRVVTATCRLGLENLERLPVKTTKPILKDHINPLLKEIYSLKLEAPIRRGQTIIKNFMNTGVDVVATRSAG
ncbi:MAG: DUF1667 domain-containing protein [Spirochaetales bacterium]|nr:DUF1667 domain-containing protein [Spirochaetales bacterium]